MVHSCVALNCTERFKKGGVSFHRFPTDEDLRKRWIKALGRANYKPNKYSKLCEKHFSPDCYDTSPWSFTKRLKEGALPTIFEFSPVVKRKYQKKPAGWIKKNKRLDQHLKEGREELPNREIDSGDCKTIKIKKNTGKKTTSGDKNTADQVKVVKSKESDLNISTALSKDSDEIVLDNTDSSLDCVKDSIFNKVDIKSKVIFDAGNSSLPPKRSRKKKILFGDYVTGERASKRKRKIFNVSEDCVEFSENNSSENKKLGMKEKPGVLYDEFSENSSSENNRYGIKQKIGVQLRNRQVVSEKNSFVSPRDEKKNYSTRAVRAEDEMSLNDFNKSFSKDIDPISEIDSKNCEKKFSLRSRKNKILSLNTIQDSNEKAQSSNLIYIENSVSQLLTESDADQSTSINIPRHLNETHVEVDNNNFENKIIAKKSKKGIKNIMASTPKEVCFNLMMTEKTMRHYDSETVVMNTSSKQVKSITNGIVKENIYMTKKKMNGNKNKDGPKTTNLPNCSIVPVIPSLYQTVSSILKLDLDNEEILLKNPVLYSKGKKKMCHQKAENEEMTDSDLDNRRDSVSSEEHFSSSSNHLRTSYIGDYKTEDLVSPVKAAKCLNLARNIITEKNKRIKYLKQRERRLMKKVDELENIIFRLVEKKMNPDEASTVLIMMNDND